MLSAVSRIQSQKNRELFFLLTDYPDKTSRMLKRIGFWNYSHASISISLKSTDFYSFTGKHGFRIETPLLKPTYKGQAVRCALYKLHVNESEYQKVKDHIESFIRNKSLLKYSYFGAFLCYLRIRFNTRKQYTCMSFISKALESSSVFDKKRSKKLIIPDDIGKRGSFQCVFEGTLKQLSEISQAV